MDFDATQVLNDRETQQLDNEVEKNPVGFLRVGSAEYKIINGFNRIGRSAVCNIIFKDLTISKIHAEIQAGPEAVFITDLRSANGTTLKNLLLKAFYFYPVNDGDVIVFGRVRATYVAAKKTSECDIHVTPKTENRATGLHANVSKSPCRPATRQRTGNNLTINDPDESVVPGSQRNDNKQRVFRLPATVSDRRTIRGRFSDIIERSDRSENRNDNESEKSLQNTDEDIHEMETQDIFDRSSFLDNSTKRPQVRGTSNVFAERPDENIFEAETQPLVAVPEPSAKLPSVTADHGDSYDAEENGIERKNGREACRVIAETDDESKTDDEIMDSVGQRDADDHSDGSITDDENKFSKSFHATFQTERRNIVAATSKVPLDEKTGDETKGNSTVSKSMINRPAAPVPPINDETDLDLLPTQVLDVATSTPMSIRQWKALQQDDFDESIPVMDDHDIHNALTQVDPAKEIRVDQKDSENSTDKEEKRTTKRNEDVNLNDSIAKNLGNIFGDEETNDNEVADEPTQLMTQNLVDILKPTQSFVRETPDSPLGTTMKNPMKKKLTSSDTSEPGSMKRKKYENVGTLGFVDGRAINNRDEFSSASTSTSTSEDVTTKGGRNGETETTANGSVALPQCDEDDDFLSGLPEVRICGTHSHPGSPTSSEASCDDDLVVSSCDKSVKMRKADDDLTLVTSAACVASSNVDESREPDSSGFMKKSRDERKLIARDRNAIEDRDSDDGLDYNELRTMADKLLASSYTSEAKLRSKLRSRSLRGAKCAEKRIIGQNEEKLSRISSSIAVTDTDGSTSSATESSTRISRKRPRQSARKFGKAARSVEEKNIVEDSRCVDSANATSASVLSFASNVKVRLTKLGDREVRTNSENDKSNLDLTNVTRKRRATLRTMETSEVSTTDETRVKNRRTIDSSLTSVEQHKILFTGVKNDDYEKMIVKLGGRVVSDPAKATVLITDKIRRTFKFLCAVARGLKIVSVNWLIESSLARHFLDCDKFILRDTEMENKYKFKLAESLNNARTQKPFQGFTIIVTPKVDQPEIRELRGIVKACGGRVIRDAPRSWDEKTVILSKEDDLAAAKIFASKSPRTMKVTIQSIEFLLTGILRQEVNFVDHRLT